MKIFLQLFLLTFIASYSLAIESFTLSTCSQHKACFKSSKNCEIDDCDYIVSWKPKKYNGKYYLEIELIGNVMSTGGYISLAFSKTQTLTNSGMVACYSTPGSTKVGFLAGYNTKDSNIIIPNDKLDEDFLVSSDKEDKFYGGLFNSISGRLSCRFMRLTTPTKHQDLLKDLSKDKTYYVLVSRGASLTSNGLNPPIPGTIISTNTPIGMYSGSFNTVQGSSKPNSVLAKIHGVMMVIAWIACCGIAVILARYYKDSWAPNRRGYNKKQYGWIEGGWFDPHRGLQSCAFILIVISIIIAFINVGGYSKLEDMPMLLHPILGLISACLFVINPFIALCRCIRTDKNRPWFNWIHFIVGTIAYILSIPTMMIGLRLPGAGLKLSLLNYPQWILIFFIIFQFIVEIILEIHGCCVYHKNRLNQNRFDREMEEFEAALQKDSTNLLKPKPPKTRGHGFRIFMLVLYILVALAVTIALSIIIIIN